MIDLLEPMPELFSKSELLILDFSEINANFPEYENIKLFFKDMTSQGLNLRHPENRQAFNDRMIKKTNCHYLIGRYGEDRIAMLNDTPAGIEGRTIHMAVDVFASNLEPVMAPCDGEVVISSYEEGFGEYGNYLIFKPGASDFYIFFGHLSSDRNLLGLCKKGEVIAHLGDYANNENGGWSRHLHLQILKELPL
jgi:murein DD-endopeptidase MepM/ murein hydrolase activator NlpD